MQTALPLALPDEDAPAAAEAVHDPSPAAATDAEAPDQGGTAPHEAPAPVATDPDAAQEQGVNEVQMDSIHTQEQHADAEEHDPGPRSAEELGALLDGLGAADVLERLADLVAIQDPDPGRPLEVRALAEAGVSVLLARLADAARDADPVPPALAAARAEAAHRAGLLAGAEGAHHAAERARRDGYRAAWEQVSTAHLDAHLRAALAAEELRRRTPPTRGARPADPWGAVPDWDALRSAVAAGGVLADDGLPDAARVARALADVRATRPDLLGTPAGPRPRPLEGGGRGWASAQQPPDVPATMPPEELRPGVPVTDPGGQQRSAAGVVMAATLRDDAQRAAEERRRRSGLWRWLQGT